MSRMSRVNMKPSPHHPSSGRTSSGLTQDQKTQLLYARMFSIYGFDASRMQISQMQPVQMQAAQMRAARMQPAQMRAARMQPAQMRAAQMRAAQMQPAQMRPVQMRSAQMRPAQMQAIHMQPAQMQSVHMHTQPTQMQVTRMPHAQLQAGQLHGLDNVPSSQSTTNADSSLNPLLPGPSKQTDRDSLREKVDQELQNGWQFDTSEWSKKPDPIQKNLYGFSREEYHFLKEQSLLRANPFYLQWEIDRREESEKLKALRPWYRKEGTDDSDLVLMSDAVLSQELDAFYGGMEKGKIPNVTVPDQNHNDHNNAAGVASNLSSTNGKNALNSFVGKAHVGSDANVTVPDQNHNDHNNAAGVASNLSSTNGKNALNSFVDKAHVGSDAPDLPSKFSMKAGPGGRLSDSGVCTDGGLKVPLRKTANSSKPGCEETGLYRAGDEDELTSADHSPYDLEGFTSDRYHDTACDLQLGPWQASIGELTEQFQPKTPDCPSVQPSATSPLELTQIATGESSNAPSVDVAVRKSSLMSGPTSVKWSAPPLNSASSSESSLPSSPDTPTPQGNTLWDKRVANAGLAPHIGLNHQLKSKHHPGDARYAMLEQAGHAQSTRLVCFTLLNMYKNRKALHKRRACDEDAASDDMIKIEDAETACSSHMPLKKKPKKFGEMKACTVQGFSQNPCGERNFHDQTQFNRNAPRSLPSSAEL